MSCSPRWASRERERVNASADGIDSSRHVKRDLGIDFEKLRLILGDEVEEGDERYAFTWPGKRDAIRQAQMTSTATLRPAPDESVNWDETGNLYIEGDNLEVLKLLQRSYHGKVKLIYIDPPYNTGHDFVYKDTFASAIENYKKQAGLTGQSNADTSGRYHSDWLSMMYPRLKLARELLDKDGAFMASIGEEEGSHLRILLDEIFGETNRVAEFTVIRAEGGGMAKQVIKGHDYLFVYARDIGFFSPLMRPKDVRGRVIERDGKRFWIQTDWLRKEFGKYGNCHYEEILQYKGASMLAEVDAGLADGRYVLVPQKNGMNLVGKLRNLSTDGSKFYSVLTQKHLNSDGNKELKGLSLDEFFEYPKPVNLVRELVQGMTLLSPQDEVLILDFFSGSSTTAHAVMKQNATDNGKRRFIMVQLPELTAPNSEAHKAGYETICEIGKERIRRAGTRIAAEVEEANKELKPGEEPKKVPDIGFRVLKLDESGVAKPEEGQLLVDRVKPGRSDLDIVFEMMLKWGLDLSFPVEEREINGYSVYSVAADELICCMKPGLTVQTIEAIAALDPAPRRVFMLDGILDDTLKLNALQIFKRVEEQRGESIDLRTV